MEAASENYGYQGEKLYLHTLYWVVISNPCSMYQASLELLIILPRPAEYRWGGAVTGTCMCLTLSFIFILDKTFSPHSKSGDLQSY